MFARWAKLMGEEHWLTDARFHDDRLRGDNGDLISTRMAAWTAERTTAEALAALDEILAELGYRPDGMAELRAKR